ncbi:MAG TPA: PH domain-containing protein [Cytophagaceae bacterium]|jgi:hypothetical protein
MQSLHKLFERFTQLNYSPITGGIAFEALANALDKEETILKVIEGSITTSVGLIIATDLRIFYIGLTRFNKTVLQQISYDSIISVEMAEPKIISVELNIITKTGGNILVRGCDYTESKKFVELLRMLTLHNSISQAS